MTTSSQVQSQGPKFRYADGKYCGVGCVGDGASYLDPLVLPTGTMVFSASYFLPSTRIFCISVPGINHYYPPVLRIETIKVSVGSEAFILLLTNVDPGEHNCSRIGGTHIKRWAPPYWDATYHTQQVSVFCFSQGIRFTVHRIAVIPCTGRNVESPPTASATTPHPDGKQQPWSDKPGQRCRARSRINKFLSKPTGPQLK